MFKNSRYSSLRTDRFCFFTWIPARLCFPEKLCHLKDGKSCKAHKVGDCTIYDEEGNITKTEVMVDYTRQKSGKENHKQLYKLMLIISANKGGS